MQSCLEKRGIEARKEHLVRSDYNIQDEYSAQHVNALATDSIHGKGTGSGGHLFRLPDCTKPTTMIDYSMFDTAQESGAGNITDRDSRKRAMANSVYNAGYQYGASLVDTEKNLSEGQYQMR